MRLSLASAFLALLAWPLSAADLPLAPGDSIQAAVDAAQDGDRILLSPGVYLGQVDLGSKAVELVGLAGASTTVLDGGGAGPVVHVAAGAGTDARLAGLTIRGGVASYGAGGLAAASGATPLVEDCIVRDNVGKFGGGIAGSPVLVRCSILDNRAGVSHGGGIHGAPQMSQCVVASNTSTHGFGGGVYLTGGSSTIEDCLFLENSAVLTARKGGALYIDSSASASISRSTFADNFAVGGVFAGLGGAVYAESAGSTLDRCTIVGNTLSGSSVQGGALYGPLVVTSSIVRDNTAPQVVGATGVSFSDVEGGLAGPGNFDAEPGFVDAASRDLHLVPSSPCIDAGDPAALDPDGTRADVGAHFHRSLYSADNSDPASWTAPSWSTLSVVVGGTQRLVTLAGDAFADHVYLMLGSVTGTAPALDLGGVLLPLEPDAYFWSRVAHPFGGPLAGGFGLLDASGRAESTFTLPNLLPTLAGVTVWHAALVLDPVTLAPVATTSAESVELVP